MSKAEEKKESAQVKDQAVKESRRKKKDVEINVEFVDRLVFAGCKLVNMAIYAMLEAPQELYFGSHTERGLNVLEKVTLQVEIGEGENTKYATLEKPFYSPTKQRGIERRAIAYAKVRTTNGAEMPYYKFFNLSIDVTKTYQNGLPDPRDILTFLWGATWTSPVLYLRGRVGYGGGVAVQPRSVVIKRRNRVEYRFFEHVEKEERRGAGESEEAAVETAQTIWLKEYLEPHVLIPVYRSYTLLGVENMEPHAVAYAFLEGLRLAGAGTPKGISVLEAYWLSEDAKEKVIVVDVSASLLPEPVVISPAILSVRAALEEFRRKALSVDEERICRSFSNPDEVFNKALNEGYCRLIGDTAYRFLRNLAEKFAKDYLMKIDVLDIPRVKEASKKSKGEQETAKETQK
ncbi:MAG: hypothetical protein QXK07_06810 [Desulfurococcaceae archaeon]